MKKRYRHSLYLQMFNEEAPVVEDTGVDDVPAAEEQTTEATQTEDKTEVAFAKKWAAKEKEWQEQKEKEIQALKDQYKDFDTFKKVTEHVQRQSGISDIMTLREEVEMQELQDRAEKENLTPEAIKRLDELEAKARRGEEAEKQLEEIRKLQEEAKEVEEFEKSIKSFCEGKEIDGTPVDYRDLWAFMADPENGVSNMEIAFKAMKADVIESKLAEAKKAGIQEYLASKTGTKTGGGVPTGTENTPAKTIKEAGQRALARIQSMKEG